MTIKAKWDGLNIGAQFVYWIGSYGGKHYLNQGALLLNALVVKLKQQK